MLPALAADNLTGTFVVVLLRHASRLTYGGPRLEAIAIGRLWRPVTPVYSLERFPRSAPRRRAAQSKGVFCASRFCMP